MLLETVVTLMVALAGPQAQLHGSSPLAAEKGPMTYPYICVVTVGEESGQFSATYPVFGPASGVRPWQVNSVIVETALAGVLPAKIEVCHEPEFGYADGNGDIVVVNEFKSGQRRLLFLQDPLDGQTAYVLPPFQNSVCSVCLPLKTQVPASLSSDRHSAVAQVLSNALKAGDTKETLGILKEVRLILPSLYLEDPLISAVEQLRSIKTKSADDQNIASMADKIAIETFRRKKVFEKAGALKMKTTTKWQQDMDNLVKSAPSNACPDF